MPAEILEKEQLSKGVFRMVLSGPKIARKRKAGQFVVIRIHEQGERIPLSASIGYTTALGDSLAAMIARADEAVYRAKEGGRNRVVEG